MESLLSVFGYKTDLQCSICKGQIRDENCSPKSCYHVFHNICLEQWAHTCQSSDEFSCPAAQCNTVFSEIVYRKKPHGKTNMVVSLKEFTQCPICCEKLTPPVATPESCNHIFCYTCLDEWSRVRHECPLDRGKYELILLFDRIGGPISRRIPAPSVRLPPPETPPEEVETNCEICSRPDDEARLLLCDHCDRGYHIYCLPVPLASVPSGDWFCPDCVRHGIGQSAPISGTPARSRGRSRRRISQVVRPLAEMEAEESDHSHLNSSNTTAQDSSRGEPETVSRELSRRSQLRLAQHAIRRYRGRQLFHDTIAQLADRIASEAASRSHRQRLRSRRVLRSENISSWLQQSDQSAASPNPAPNAAAPSTSRTHSGDENHNPRGSVVTRSKSNRKRLLVLSSDSESQDEAGIPLRLPSMTRPRARLLRPSDDSETSESDEDRYPAPPPRQTTATTSSTTTSCPREVRSPPVTSQPFLETPAGTTGADVESVQRPSTRTRSTRSVATRREARRKRSRDGARRGKRAKSRWSRTTGRRRSRRQPEMTRAQKRLKKVMAMTSRSSKRLNSHRPPPPISRKATGDSLEGQQISRNTDSNPVPSTSYSTGNQEPACPRSFVNPVTSKYFQAISAPRPKTLQRQVPSQLITPTTSAPPRPSTGAQATRPAPNPPAAAGTSSSSGPPVTTSVAAGTSNGLAASGLPEAPVNGTPGGRECARSVPGRQEIVWSPGRLRKAQSILVTTLTAHLRNGLINQRVYSEILQRATYKIKQKEPSKVTDVRIVKLASDYVHYYKCRAEFSRPQ